MPTIGLAMITKDVASTLSFCLQSVHGLVSEIVIADTGSTDHTISIAEEFGATVLSIPWNDDFAQARNSALAASTTDWILVLDADEELSEGARTVLFSLSHCPDDIGGYLLPIRNYLREEQLIFRD